MNKFKLLISALLIITAGIANAQQPKITAAEYFWDTDPGFGSGTALAVTKGPTIDLSTNISTAALSEGFHVFYFRTMDSTGVWSHTNHQAVWVTPPPSSVYPEIETAEYFWDTDPGFGSGTSLAITPGRYIDFSTNVSTAALSEGYHTFYFRTKDSTGVWSHTNHQTVWVTAPPSVTYPEIEAAEYFWDTEPGFGSGTPLAIVAGRYIDFSTNISTAGLSEGLHRFYFRTKDSTGVWSHTNNQNVWVTAPPSTVYPEIEAAEYYWDTDPGFGNGTSLAITPGRYVDYSTNLSTAALSHGLHTFYFRTKDSTGVWSHTNHQTVWVTPPPSPIYPEITEAEYYWDTDPGFGNGTSLAITPGRYVDYSTNLSTAALSHGLHTFYFRTKDSTGVWSHTNHQTVWVTPPPSPVYPEITEAEYYWDTDPGFGNGTPLAITQGRYVDFSTNLSTAALSHGLHRFYYRTKDSTGVWSHTNNQTVWVTPPPSPVYPEITEAEYYWDTDPGFGNGTPMAITPGRYVDYSTNLSTSALSTGLHRFYFRTKDSTGVWSHTNNQAIWVTSAPSTVYPQIVAAEYFWDTDPGFGNGTAMAVTPDRYINISPIISTSSLSPGLHRFYFRTKDSTGVWSHTNNQNVWVAVATETAVPQIISAEYFWDTEPGFGNGHAISLSTVAQLINEDLTVHMCGLGSGDHNLYLRVKDTSGRWSHMYFSTVAVTNDGNPPPFTVTASNSSPTCEGQNTQLSVTGATGFSVTWSGPDGFSSNLINPEITGLTSAKEGDYIVAVDNACSMSYDTTTVTMIPTTVPSVSIVVDNNPACTDSLVTFTATPVNGGTTPSYQWKLNGGNVGSDSPNYSVSTLSDGDVVSCVLTSNANCANPLTATSNSINMTVAICLQWTGVVDTNWHNPGNWNPNVVPQSNNSVGITSSAVRQPVIYVQNAQCASLKLYNGASLKMLDAKTLELYGSNFNCQGTFTPGNGTVAFLGTTSLINNPAAVQFNNLTITPTGAFTLAGNPINIKGNFTNNGEFIPAGKSVTFNGTSQQVVKSGTTVFYDLIFNNTTSGSDDLILTDSMSFSNSATFTNGVLNCDSFSTKFIALDNATNNDGNFNSYVSGVAQKEGDDAYIFPIGKDNVWAPIGIDAPATPSVISAEYFTQASQYWDSTDFMCGASGLDHTSQVEYWDIITNNEHPDVTLFWKNGNYSGVAILAMTLFAHWEDCGGEDKWVNKTGSRGGTASSGWVKSSGLVGYSPITLGSTSPANPLPVSLTSFDAVCNNNIVSLNWETATEYHSDRFVIQSSEDAENWVYAGEVKAAGNSNQKQTYTYTINSKSNGAIYYRLMQFDFNGNAATFGPAVAICESGEEMFSIYPNPNTGSFVIQANKEISGTSVIEIYNILGEIIYTRKTDNLINQEINLGDVPTGVYYLNIVNDKLNTDNPVKFVVNNQ